MPKPNRPVLRAPIKELLDDELPEARVQQMWRALQSAPARKRRGFTARSQLWAAAAALLVSIGTGGFIYARSRPTALAIQGADTLTPRRALGGDSSSSYRLTDGSVIRLGEAARVEVLANDAHAFEVRLETGRARFDVKPGGPRRWRVDCGDLNVEVVGTSFTVEREANGIGVRVEHGIVVVRGSRVPSGLERLTAGERLYVAAAPEPVPSGQVGASASAPQPTAAVSPAAPAAEPPPQPTPVVEAPARRAPAAVAVRPQPTAAELAKLLQAADRARRADRPLEAERILDRVRAADPDSTHAALAALTLARMRIASTPSLAATDLEAALAGKLPAALREDAAARLVEAHARAGDAGRARRAAAAYAREFPRGRRAADVERWIRSP